MNSSTILDICKQIPGYMVDSEPEILFQIFSKYNQKDTIGVEVGSLHGRSSFVISQAISNGKLFCIDNWAGNSTYNHNLYDVDNPKGFPPDGTFNTLEFFLENTKLCSNIEAIKGNSPSIVANWETKIDFVFLDCAHINPSDIINIIFWLPKIKKNGCLVGHDYSPNWLDVIKNVRYLEKILNQPVSLYPDTTIWKFDIK